MLIDIWTAEGERLMLATIRCHTVVFFETASLSKILRSQDFDDFECRSGPELKNRSLRGLKKCRKESKRATGSNKDSQKVS